MWIVVTGLMILAGGMVREQGQGIDDFGWRRGEQTAAASNGSESGTAVTVIAGPPVGTVSFDGPVPVLGCGDGALELQVVQPPGRRAMRGEDFLRGRRAAADR